MLLNIFCQTFGIGSQCLLGRDHKTQIAVKDWFVNVVTLVFK